MAAKRLNVLIVDRDEGSNVELKDFLSAEGYQVHALGDPEQVVAEVKKGRVQLVLLDVSPPETHGAELLQRIRNADSDLCVIATTALPTVEMAVRTLKKQAFDYLQKPLDLEELRQVIEAAVREKGLLVDLETRLNQVVGKRLRERRTTAGLTLKQLANRTGLSVSLISQIELGKSAASMSTLHKLATALQVKMTYFFETV
jgi:two-component system OmpR family response regulator